MAGEYAKALGAKLRTVRNQQGLSLQGVEAASGGRWKAVVIGSYERGDRAVTVQRLSELAEFYGVPLADLLPDDPQDRPPAPPPRLVIDLDRLAEAPVDGTGPLLRFVTAIRALRADDGGPLLALRADDLGTLALLHDESPEQLLDRLTALGVLSPEAGRSAQ